MTTNTKPVSALDGLLTCGECGGPMVFSEGQGPRYTCRSTPPNGRCRTPALHAGQTEDLIIGAVLPAILTERSIATAVTVANEPGPGDLAQEFRVTRDEIRDLKVNPGHFIEAVGGPTKTRTFLAGFITGIRLHAHKGVINYSIPLPEESPLAGMSQQEIDIPEEVLVQRE